jgi:hypothetical protein
MNDKNNICMIKRCAGMTESNAGMTERGGNICLSFGHWNDGNNTCTTESNAGMTEKRDMNNGERCTGMMETIYVL